MKIRKARAEDLPRMMEVYERARSFMRRMGNHRQWVNGYPSVELLRTDIETGVSFVMTTDEGEIVGVFTFIIGEDPTYAEIEGRWLNDRPYGTIHRIASDGTQRGVADECLRFCRSRIADIRIDTHADNVVMLNWIRRSGFDYCGVIHVADGSPRHAFQLPT